MGFKILKSGITRRWIINIFTVVFVVVCIFTIAASFAVRSYYVSSARQSLMNKADIDASYFEEFYASQAELTSGVRGYVESFPQKDRIELMVANSAGRITLTSSGFAADDAAPPDVASALNEDTASYVGENSYGENIIAVSRAVRLNGTVVCVLRYVISMKSIQSRVIWVIGIISVIGLLLLLASYMSGRYFVRSIISPLAKITETTKRIAENDFSVRIDDKYSDEIGDLAHEINNMAEALGASESMKNDFTSSISHELLTPLTAIRGWSETLSDPEMRSDEMIEKGMKVISAESTRLSSMVEELLDFSRLQSGRMTVNMNMLDLIAELEETVIMFEERAKKNNISLILTAPENCSPVLGDAARIKQVFVNIIDNAIKYCRPEGGKVEINLFEKKDRVCIVITDDGIGISPEDLPRIKQKFFKGASARPGSGIGLAIVSEIVNLHGGEFEVDSVLDKGTTVMLTFPIVQTQAEKLQENGEI